MTLEESNMLETIDNNYWIEMDKSLSRLMSNPDFNKVILEGYLKEKALGNVAMLGRHDVKKRGERPDVMEELIAISNLGEYLYMIPQLAGSAKVDKEEFETVGN